jgi:predicted transcriptional regulator
MAKRKSRKEDRHLTSNMIRLSRPWFELFRELAQEGQRPVTWEILLALAAYAEAKGREHPPMPWQQKEGE